jgi:hypothetical protein
MLTLHFILLIFCHRENWFYFKLKLLKILCYVFNKRKPDVKCIEEKYVAQNMYICNLNDISLTKPLAIKANLNKVIKNFYQLRNTEIPTIFFKTIYISMSSILRNFNIT